MHYAVEGVIMQNTINFPHFQYTSDGKKRVTHFSLQG